MRQFEAEIEGISPLLMNNPEKTIFATTHKKQVGATKGTPVEDLLYKTKDGKLYQPSTHIEQALIKCAVNFKIPGKRGKSYKDIFKAFVVVDPKKVIHKIQDWESFATSVVINRKRVMKERPLLENWKLKFKINVLNEEVLPAKLIRENLEYAGAFNGLGDWRPKFGLFKVTEFKDVTDIGAERSGEERTG